MKWFSVVLLVSCLIVPQQLLAAPAVLFDEGHGQQFLVRGDQPLDLSALARVFHEAGGDVRSSREALTDASLSGMTALVISGAFQPLSVEEVAAVRHFVEQGGNLAVMLHVAPPLRTLLDLLQVDFTNGTVREQTDLIAENPQDFRVRDLAPHLLLEGLTDFAVYGAWALRGTAPGVETLARTSLRGWVDLNHDRKLDAGDAVQPFGLLVAGQLGHGHFAVFGDDALFQNRFLEGNNRRLAGNLARWLLSNAGH